MTLWQVTQRQPHKKYGPLKYICGCSMTYEHVEIHSKEVVF